MPALRAAALPIPENASRDLSTSGVYPDSVGASLRYKPAQHCRVRHQDVPRAENFRDIV